jgi:hypothetical protein
MSEDCPRRAPERGLQHQHARALPPLDEPKHDDLQEHDRGRVYGEGDAERRFSVIADAYRTCVSGDKRKRNSFCYGRRLLAAAGRVL